MSAAVQNQQMDDYIKEIQEAILNFEDLKNNQEEITSSTFSLQENNEFSEKIEPFENVKFSGNDDIQHPKSFIETFEKIAFEGNLSETEKQHYFTQSLVGEAAIWLQDHRFGTYEQLKTDFLNFYWSLSKEESFLDHLDVGKYNINCGLSMTEYFLKYFNGAKFSKGVFSEEVLISDLLQHFDFKKEVETAFNLQSVKSLEEALDVLKKIDALKSPDNEEIRSTAIPKMSKKSSSRKRKNNIFYKDKLFSFFAKVILSISIFLGILCLFIEYNPTVKYFINEYTSSPAQINQVKLYTNAYQHYQKLIPFQTLKFSGKKDSTHPKSFIRNFEHIVAQENLDEYTKKHCFIQSLVGNARNWLSLRGYGTFEEMKEAFLEFYWSSEIQKAFRDFLKNGKYDEKSMISHSEYFHKYVNEAKFLDNAPRDEEVISYLLHHFNLRTEIQIALEIRPVQTIEEALGILTKSEELVNSSFQKKRRIVEAVLFFCLMTFIFGVISFHLQTMLINSEDPRSFRDKFIKDFFIVCTLGCVYLGLILYLCT